MEPVVILSIAAIVGVILVLGLFLARSSKKEAPVALTMQYKPFKLIEKEQLSHNTLRFRFQLDTPMHRVGLPIGNHILLKYIENDEKKTEVSRPYTPVSSDEDLGYVDFVIKVYPNGKMSTHLQKMSVGESILARGPLGMIKYHGKGVFEIKRKNPETNQTMIVNRPIKRVGMIAGGTGITPMMQIARQILKHGNDKTEVSLIFANVTEDDILLRKELENAKTHTNFKIYYTLDKPADDWKYGKGFVTADMIQKHLFPPADDTLILLCGPTPMMNFMEKNLAALEYKSEHYFVF